MSGAKLFAETVGYWFIPKYKNDSGRGAFRNFYGSENVGLSNENIGENPMPWKPKVSDARFVHVGLVRT